MISNPDNITKVLRGSRELFFLYKGKYKWSMRREGDTHSLWFYPGNERIEQLVGHDDPESDWDGVSMVHYSDTEIGTKEARASFSELFTLLKERVFGVNTVLDDIIADMDDESA